MEPGPNGTIYVGGHFSSAGATDARNLAIWDPATSTWSKPPFDFPVSPGFGCYCVRALEADAGGVFVGGTFPHVEVNGNRIEGISIFYWDRAANEIRTMGGGVTFNTGNLDVTGTVHDIAIAPTGELYIVGHFDKVSGVGARHVARLTAAGWQAMGAGLAHSYEYTDPAAIEFLGIGSQLIVAGQFTSAGEAQSPNVAIWDLEQNAWLPFGTGFVSDTTDESVFALAAGPDAIYFGGEFVDAGGAPAASFTRWAPKPDELQIAQSKSKSKSLYYRRAGKANAPNLSDITSIASEIPTRRK